MEPAVRMGRLHPDLGALPPRSRRDAAPRSGDRTPPLGNAPQPPLPLPGRPADIDKLEQARELFSGPEHRGALGPYAFFTDIDDAALISRLSSIADNLEAAYVERYGLVPVGDAAETVVFYREEAAYRELRDTWADIRESASSGLAGFGLAVSFLGGRPRPELARTLVHELTHFLNRRALGPALPAWLDEGMADDLALSYIDPSGRLIAGTLAGSRRDLDGHYELHGTLAAVAVLVRRLDRSEPVLPDLLELDGGQLGAVSDSGLHYAASAFFIRCLLADECGTASAGAFTAFLAGVSRGESAQWTALLAKMGSSWSEIEERLRSYVREQASTVLLDTEVVASYSGSSSRQRSSPPV